MGSWLATFAPSSEWLWLCASEFLYAPKWVLVIVLVSSLQGSLSLGLVWFTMYGLETASTDRREECPADTGYAPKWVLTIVCWWVHCGVPSPRPYLGHHVCLATTSTGRKEECPTVMGCGRTDRHRHMNRPHYKQLEPSLCLRINIVI